jgi:iron complex outermembrane receptor protein
MYRESTNNPWLSSDSYTVVNARVGVAADSGKWELAAWAKNLTDEEYTQEVFGSDIIGMVTALYGNPRQYGVTLNYNF